jgi:diguanylate cyclase (GGDEF)-like protein
VQGHSVRTAASGREAILEVRRHRPNLVLLDVMMPNMDGFEAARAIKQEPGPFLPVILLTALHDRASRERGIETGADEMLLKPVQPFELQLRVRAMLRIQHLSFALHEANERLRELARTDELTGVNNRRGLQGALAREMDRARRYSTALSIMMVDIDRFKSVNDSLGHTVGDRVLCGVADALQEQLRQVDIIGRVGGEEFVVVMPETPLNEAMRVAERLRAAVAAMQVRTGRGNHVSVTISAGVAMLDQNHFETPDHLLERADRALYHAKESGRNRCEAAPSPYSVIDSSETVSTRMS